MKNLGLGVKPELDQTLKVVLKLERKDGIINGM